MAGRQGIHRRELLADERGFTLVEVLVSSLILVVVLGAALGLLSSTSNVAAKDQERPTAIAGAQVGVARMTRELRQATAVFTVGGLAVTAYPATGSSIEVGVRVGGVDMRVLYDCGVSAAGATDRECLRKSSTVLTSQLSSTGGSLVVPHLFNGTAVGPSTPVFDLTAASYMTLELVVPEGGGAVNGFKSTSTFGGGIYIRNVGSQ